MRLLDTVLRGCSWQLRTPLTQKAFPMSGVLRGVSCATELMAGDVDRLYDVRLRSKTGRLKSTRVISVEKNNIAYWSVS